jgi:Flp pilus assembly CpaE family ATPase
LAVGIADELARMDVSTLLADADSYGPSVAQHLGLLDDSSGLAAACRLAGQGRLDAAMIARTAVALPSGLRVLTGIPRVDRWDELRPAALDMVWQEARELAKFSIADVGFCIEHDELAWFEPGHPSRNQAAVATLAAADVVIAVTSADPVGLVRFLRAAPAVQALAPTARFDVVVNRVPSGRDHARDLRAMLFEHMNIERPALIPDDPQAFDACLRSGRTLPEVAPRSDARKRMREIAAELGGVRPNRKRRRAA